MGLSQEEFGKKINLSKPTISAFETQTRNMNDRVINDICSEFSVNEDWLRYGKGEMFIQPDTFSLDEYAKQNNLSSLELDILKGYMALDSNVRKEIMSHFKAIFGKHSEVTATKEEDYIEQEIENYRLELEAELKGVTLPVSEDIKNTEKKTS